MERSEFDLSNHQTLEAFSLDADLRYTSFNSTHARSVSTYLNHEIKNGESFIDLLKTKDQKAEAKKCFKKALAGESFSASKSLITNHFTQCHLAPIRDKKESVIGISVIINAEHLPFPPNNAFDHIAERLPVIVFETDLSMHVTYANEEAYKAFGYSHSDFESGVNGIMMVAESERQKAQENIAARLQGDDMGPVEYLALRKDGSTFPALFYTGIIAQNGVPSGFRGAVIDISDRKEIELALKSSESKYRALFQGADEGILVAEIDSKQFIFSNPSMQEMTGFTEKDILQMSVRNMHPESELAAVQEEFEALAAGKKRHSKELLFLRKDGTAFPATVSATRVDWDEKDCLVGFISNIEKRKKVELDLQESDEMFKKLFDSSKDAIMTLDPPSWKFTSGNQAILEMFKVKDIDEWTSIGPWMVSPEYQPEGRPSSDMAKEMIQTAMVEGSNFFEWTHQRRTGEDFFATVLLTRVDLPDRQFLQATVRDITEQKLAEQTLNFQTELQRILMDIAAKFINRPLSEVDQLIYSSLQEMAEFVDADRAYMFDYDLDERVCNNTHEWSRTDVESMIDHSQNLPIDATPELVKPHFEGKSVYIPNTEELPEGGSKWLMRSQNVKSILTVPMIQNDKCIGFVGFDSVLKSHTYSNKEIDLLKLFADVMVNIKNRTQKQKELTDLLQMATDQNIRLKDFSFMTSHNIRASVANLLGLSKMIDEDPSNKSYLEMLDTTTQKLSQTIDNINELINFENNLDKMEMVDCNLHEAINRVMKLTNQIIDRKEVQVYIDVPQDLTINAYPAYLDSIMHNLFTNALKYGIREDSKMIEISAKQKKSKTIVSIKDYGLGIDLEKFSDRLYELGTRLHEHSDGQGLGLYMTKRQIEAMNGTIKLESKVNRGTTFKLVFPIPD